MNTLRGQMEKMQAKVMSLSRDKEDLLRSLADARREQQQQQQQPSTPRPGHDVDADNRSHCSTHEEVVAPMGRSGGEGRSVTPGGGWREAERSTDSCGDNAVAVGDRGTDDDDHDDGVDDDEVLVPRGGPVPVPSPLTPRRGAGVVGVGMGPLGRPTGRSVAAATLLRCDIAAGGSSCCRLFAQSYQRVLTRLFLFSPECENVPACRRPNGH